MEKNLALSEALRTAISRRAGSFRDAVREVDRCTHLVHPKNSFAEHLAAWCTKNDSRWEESKTRTDRIPPKELDDKVRTPFFYRNCALHISRETTQEELTFQLAVIFSRWGLIELTTEDLETFVSYLCHFWRRPEEFRGAAEGAVGFIFTNWVYLIILSISGVYARQTAWACYAKGARSSKRDAEPRSARFEEESAAEKEQSGIERERQRATPYA